MLSCALLKLWWYLYIGELNLSTFCMQHLAISNRFPISISSSDSDVFLALFISMAYKTSMSVLLNADTFFGGVFLIWSSSISLDYLHLHSSLDWSSTILFFNVYWATTPLKFEPIYVYINVDWTQLIANINLLNVNIINDRSF